MRTSSGEAGATAASALLREWFGWLQSPRTRWRLPALGAIVATAAAAVWQTAWPPMYTATARIVVDPGAAGAAGTASEWIATQVEILRSDRVAQRVAADLNIGESVDRLLGRVRVTSASGSGIIAVQYPGLDPGIASRVADAFVAAYDRVSRDMQAATLAAIGERARARFVALRDEADQAQLRMQAADRETQDSIPSLAKAVRIAPLEPPAWSGLPGEQRPQARSASLLAGTNEDAGLGGASLDRPASAVALEDAHSDAQQAREALLVAQTRWEQFDADRMLARPLMTVLNRGAESVETAMPGTTRLYAFAALAGLLAAWVLRLAARRIDRRVTDVQDVSGIAGLAVLGVLTRAGEPPRLPRAVRAVHASWAERPGTVPALT